MRKIVGDGLALVGVAGFLVFGFVFLARYVRAAGDYGWRPGLVRLGRTSFGWVIGSWCGFLLLNVGLIVADGWSLLAGGRLVLPCLFILQAVASRRRAARG